MNSIAEHRRFYAELVVRSAGSADARLVDAFAQVPRERFVGPGPWHVFVGDGYITTPTDDPRFLYQDVLIALAPERNINNGQPSLHARCLAACAPAPGESVFHLGAGTGYYSAILAALVEPTGSVMAVEREEDLAGRAARALQGYPNVAVRTTSAVDLRLPLCDVIYVNAGATDPPHGWLEALRTGGRLVFPLTTNAGWGVMLMITRRAEDRYAATAFSRAAFIPCVGARNDATSEELARALERQSLKEVCSLRRRSAPDASAWCVGHGWWLSSKEAHED